MEDDTHRDEAAGADSDAAPDAATAAASPPAAAAAAASSCSRVVLSVVRPSRRCTALPRCDRCAVSGARMRDLCATFPLLCDGCFQQAKRHSALAKKEARQTHTAHNTHTAPEPADRDIPDAVSAVHTPTPTANASRKRKSGAARSPEDAPAAAAAAAAASSTLPRPSDQLAAQAAALEAALVNADAASRAKLRQRLKPAEAFAATQVRTEPRVPKKRPGRPPGGAADAAAAATRVAPRSNPSSVPRRSLRRDRRSKRVRRAPNKFKIEVGSSSEEESDSDATATQAAAAPSCRRSAVRPRRTAAAAPAAPSPSVSAPWDCENDSWPSDFENSVEMQLDKRDTSNALHKLWAHTEESLSYPPMPMRVAIIGAGVSGLVAAHQLASRGFHVIIVEARKRIGGRILTWQLPSVAQPPNTHKKSKANLPERGASAAAVAPSAGAPSVSVSSSVVRVSSRGPHAGSSLPVDLGAAFLHGCDPDGLNPVYEFLRQQRTPHTITLTTKFDTNDAIYCRTKRAVEQSKHNGAAQETGATTAAAAAAAVPVVPSVRVSRRKCERAWDRYEQLDAFMLDQSMLLHAQTRKQKQRRKRQSNNTTAQATEQQHDSASAPAAAACASLSSDSSSDESELSLDSDFGMDVAFETALQQLDEAETEAKERRRAECGEEPKPAAASVSSSTRPGPYQSLSLLDVDLLHLVSATQHAYVAPMCDLSLKDLAECFEAGVLGGDYRVVSPDAHGYSSVILALRARLAKMPNVEFRMGTEVNKVEYGLANDPQQLQHAIAQARAIISRNSNGEAPKAGGQGANAAVAADSASGEWPAFSRDFVLPPDFVSAVATARSAAPSVAAAPVPAPFQESEFGLLPPLSSTPKPQVGQACNLRLDPLRSPPLPYTSASPPSHASQLGATSLGVRLHTSTVDFDEFTSTAPNVMGRGIKCTSTGAGVVDRSHSVAGTIEADFALVTASIGVLQRDLIQFSPALPAAKSRALRCLGMGCENKVILQFAPDRIFWGPNETAGHVHYLRMVQEHRYKFLNLHAFGVVGVLVAQAPPPHSRRISGLTDRQVVEEVLGILRGMFGDAVPPPLRTHITRWHDDPYAFGSYSFVAKGSDASMIREYARPVPPLFFSGEGSHSTDGQTVHGAWLSAVAAARDITKHALSLPANCRSVRVDSHEKLYLPRSHFEAQRRRIEAPGVQHDDDPRADLDADASEAALAANRRARTEANRQLRMRGRTSKRDTRILQHMQRMLNARRATSSEAASSTADLSSALSAPIVIEDANDDSDAAAEPASVDVSPPSSSVVAERPAKRARANHHGPAGGQARSAATGKHKDPHAGHTFGFGARRPTAAVHPASAAAAVAAAASGSPAAAAASSFSASLAWPVPTLAPVSPPPPPSSLSADSAVAAAANSARHVSSALLQPPPHQLQPDHPPPPPPHLHPSQPTPMPACDSPQHAAAMLRAAAMEQQQRAMVSMQWQPPMPLLQPPYLPPPAAGHLFFPAYSPVASFDSSMQLYPLPLAHATAAPAIVMHNAFPQQL